MVGGSDGGAGSSCARRDAGTRARQVGHLRLLASHRSAHWRQVAWPPVECSVPVCAVQQASSSRLQCWHQQWGEWGDARNAVVGSLADKMETMLLEAQRCEGGRKEKVSELTECYGELEEKQRELLELDMGFEGVGDERLANLQRGIQRFAALARFG